jgi:ElaB/YqjD/DUF883 family membrane-anchored ribosome-binding protein
MHVSKHVIGKVPQRRTLQIQARTVQAVVIDSRLLDFQQVKAPFTAREGRKMLGHMREKMGNGHGVQDEVQQLLGDLRSVVREGEELLRGHIGNLTDQARAKAESTGRLVREHPLQTAGVAFAAGLIVGGLAMGCLLRGQEEE